MIIDEMNEQIKIAGDALQKVTFQMQGMIVILHKIAAEDYQKEVVDTGMVELEEMNKADWIQDRLSYYLSDEFSK